ncbi:MAG: multidrug transporter [Hespellia sp.]|nr:multidrug transporter [Hespellia sp.]
MEPTKKDWKLFRERITGWQEAYMERLIQEYVQFLESDIPASTKFWEMEKKIKNDKRTPGVLIELRKSTMLWDIIQLINDEVITLNDLDGFSEELIETVKYILSR